ncbi:MAG: pirin family protein [Leptospiraceae bacterium]|nr:pirin family protein [Leptospiraceae bacterium]
MKILDRSNSRGFADFGWLKTHHTFSFGHYFNPNRIQFGALRVLNDDIVAPGMGFSTHGHENMEIISIPLHGSIAHKDSTGTDGIINTGEVQVMSAGSGIRHSEFNPSPEKSLNFLQIWVLPKIKNINPRYDQKEFSKDARINRFQTIVSPDQSSESLWINQDAYFNLANIEKGKLLSYFLKNEANGTYIFVISGKISIANEILEKRDGFGISNESEISIEAIEDSEILLIEVPT